ncbi:Na/Pi symporter [Desertifilum sp. FACHB-1129]|uniref:Sodium:phosphate symporter n=2 Tax=Desertifilum tharense IPPAS B-1220 TaxID=1781255 RepID=A0A1E5QM96_9CYAN|nr:MULTISPECIES: Na/Pi symporter [Desertifilum]MDA0210483.1 Na/Pi symporter [Cyanobacteria bacterium FC1]MBD2311483.1 Na/Pi symporter [Desertifilum sp. FACHB-1129]MBD2323057.1 Na/Pi symporter [Desertifilum sp. FACHB-866]MBD2332902.1 Na/Pi symporter [Desertifilum sp. FACHB-868]OEJ75760.1 hypothetical protein BH720_07445 [Desertifilum tharense IPPAS B-1220]
MKRISQVLPQGQIWKFIGLLLALLIFFTSLELLGDAFELMGENAAEFLLATTANPIAGVFVGILATTLVQSSSTSTSLTVALVASGTLGVAGAIPIMLGANIGTSVTNTIVALGHFHNRDEFRKAFTGALVLDFFNIIAVAIFLPLELFFNVLSWPATQVTNLIVGIGAIELFSPIDVVVEPLAGLIVGLTQETGWLVLIIAFALLYFALRSLVKVLKALLNEDLEGKIKKYLFGSWWQAMLFGLLITIAVQSSSITTSVIIPLIALAVVAALQALPYFLGANIGTSTTALIAALSLAGNGDAEGIASLLVALVHMVFDILAIALLFPLKKVREIPVWLAQKSVSWITANRITAIAYIAALFYLLPFGAAWLTNDWDIATFYEPTVPEQIQGEVVTDLEDAQDRDLTDITDPDSTPQE